MKCSNCGNENPVDSVFCEKCGAKLEVNASKNQTNTKTENNDTPKKLSKKGKLSRTSKILIAVIAVVILGGGLLTVYNYLPDKFKYDKYDKYFYSIIDEETAGDKATVPDTTNSTYNETTPTNEPPDTDEQKYANIRAFESNHSVIVTGINMYIAVNNGKLPESVADFSTYLLDEKGKLSGNDLSTLYTEPAGATYEFSKTTNGFVLTSTYADDPDSPLVYSKSK